MNAIAFRDTKRRNSPAAHSLAQRQRPNKSGLSITDNRRESLLQRRLISLSMESKRGMESPVLQLARNKKSEAKAIGMMVFGEGLLGGLGSLNPSDKEKNGKIGLGNTIKMARGILIMVMASEFVEKRPSLKKTLGNLSSLMLSMEGILTIFSPVGNPVESILSKFRGFVKMIRGVIKLNQVNDPSETAIGDERQLLVGVAHLVESLIMFGEAPFKFSSDATGQGLLKGSIALLKSFRTYKDFRKYSPEGTEVELNTMMELNDTEELTDLI